MPFSERPRERCRRLGPEALSLQELLAIVMGRGTSRRSVLTIAQDLVERFKSLKNISCATVEELAEVKGVGPAKALQLKASFELGRRALVPASSPYDQYAVTGPASIVEALKGEIGEKKKEHFKCILLNTRNGIIAVTDISMGTVNASIVHPREVFHDAIRHSATSVVLVHNHPSGNPEPSREDLAITERLVEVGRIVGIDVVDHVILVREGYLSFREKGLI